MSVKITNRLLLNQSTLPNIRFVNNEDYMSDYNSPTDTVSININPKYNLDKTYLSVLGIIESSVNPVRGIGNLDTSNLLYLYPTTKYLCDRINLHVGALIMMVYLNSWTRERHGIVYGAIRFACKKSNVIPSINLAAIHQMCSYYILRDDKGKNRDKLNGIFNRVTGKILRDFSGDLNINNKT